VPAEIKRRRPGADVVTVAFVEVAADAATPEAYAPRFHAPKLPFDLVWFTPRWSDEDQCAQLRKKSIERVRLLSNEVFSGARFRWPRRARAGAWARLRRSFSQVIWPWRALGAGLGPRGGRSGAGRRTALAPRRRCPPPRGACRRECARCGENAG